jgi:hypothetical protein
MKQINRTSRNEATAVWIFAQNTILNWPLIPQAFLVVQLQAVILTSKVTLHVTFASKHPLRRENFRLLHPSCPR